MNCTTDLVSHNTKCTACCNCCDLITIKLAAAGRPQMQNIFLKRQTCCHTGFPYKNIARLTYISYSWFTTVALTVMAGRFSVSVIYPNSKGRNTESADVVHRCFWSSLPVQMSPWCQPYSGKLQSKLTMLNANYFLTIPQQNIQSLTIHINYSLRMWQVILNLTQTQFHWSAKN